MQVRVAHCLMMRRRVVLGKVIGKIAFSFVPVDSKVLLLLSIADPVETHIDCSSFLLFDGIIC